MHEFKVFQVIGKHFWNWDRHHSTGMPLGQLQLHVLWPSRGIKWPEQKVNKKSHRISFQPRWMSSMNQFNLLPWNTKNLLNIWNNDFKILGNGQHRTVLPEFSLSEKVSLMTSGFPLHKAGILKDLYCVTGVART